MPSTVLCLLGSLLLAQAAPSDPKPFPGAVSRWEGFVRHDFDLDGANVIVVEPEDPLPGRPWAWRGEFFGAYANADAELVRRGWHLVSVSAPDLFGAPAAMTRWERLHEVMVQDHGLAPKPALIGLSRGALYCMAWAAKHPDRTLLVYLDNGVCDFKSWPGGRPKGLGTGQGSPEEWAKLLQAYGFRDDAEAIAARVNPVDSLAPLAGARIPLLLVYGDSDRVVPHRENSERVYDRYRALGGPVERIVKPGQDHHPHGLTDPRPIVDFFESVRVPVAFRITDPGGTARFAAQSPAPAFGAADPALPTIAIDRTQAFQSIDGFGYTLTGGSAELLSRMTPDRRAALLQELFATEGDGIGVSYLRLSIGASDLDGRVFSYDDGAADPELTRFSLDPDRAHLIPVLKQILAIVPDLKLMASPWSPPAWMKTNGSSVGGSLKPEFQAAYAAYFVKYLQGMRAEGVRIDAVTVQNEPLHGGNNPSLLMTAAEQAGFIKHHLGPAFRKAGLDTKIVIYDHNCDRPDYPIAILDDPEAAQFIDGTAFHLYGGKIDAMAQVHDAHPDKHLYFTEQWIGAPGDLRGDLAWHTRELIVGATRHWARTVLEWNLASDPKQEPHTPGGCDRCLGALTLDGDAVTRNPAYYIVAHAAKSVRPGSVRIASDAVAGLPNVAFTTPDGRTVLIVLNDSPAPRSFTVRDGDRTLPLSLPPGAVGTCTWR